MKLSIIVPAYNEEKRIEGCLRSIFASLTFFATSNIEREVIVVDNNSTDSTAEIVRRFDVRLVFESINQIARARNAGAAVATGDWLIFLDADTQLSPGTLNELIEQIRSGKVLGGASILRFDRIDFIGFGFVALSNVVIRALQFTCGCFMYCRADAFRDLNGFDEELFAGEDADFGKRMKLLARHQNQRLAILRRHPPVTSFRKIDLYGWDEAFKLILRWLFFPAATMRDKSRLHIFYDDRG